MKTLKENMKRFGTKNLHEQQAAADDGTQYFKVYKKNGVRQGFSEPDAKGIQKYKGFTRQQLLDSPAFAAASETSERSTFAKHKTVDNYRMGKVNPNGKHVIRVK